MESEKALTVLLTDPKSEFVKKFDKLLKRFFFEEIWKLFWTSRVLPQVEEAKMLLIRFKAKTSTLGFL